MAFASKSPWVIHAAGDEEDVGVLGIARVHHAEPLAVEAGAQRR